MSLDVLAVLSIAGPLLTAGAVYGLLRGRVEQNRADIARLHAEKASKESVDGLKAWLDERFRHLERLIARESSGPYPRAPGRE